jgi:Protein of unknown function (DUF4230)
MTTQSGETTGVTRSLPADGTGTQPQIVYVQQKAHWGRRLLVLLGVIALLGAVSLGLMAVDKFPKLHNPFATQTTDRTGPVLLLSVKDLSRYVAAEGAFQVLVDVQENKALIPDFIFNDHTLFVGIGTVDAYVDFGNIDDGAIVTDGTSVTINLPAPQLDKPSLDVDKSYVFAEDKGLTNRIGDFFNSNPNDKQQLYQLAEQKIIAAADDTELKNRAETNTRAMLEGLFKSLGYERVTVNFANP